MVQGIVSNADEGVQENKTVKYALEQHMKVMPLEKLFRREVMGLSPWQIAE